MVTCCECEIRYAIVKLQVGNLWKDVCLVCVKEDKQSTGDEPVIFDETIHATIEESIAIDTLKDSDLYYPFNELSSIEDKFKELTSLQMRANDRDNQEEVRNIASMKKAIAESLHRMTEKYT